MELRQLIPHEARVEVQKLLGELDLAAQASPERPYTVVNFVTTLDGRVTFHGRSGPLGDEADREMFHGLRERVEAVLVGTGTLRVERYRRLTVDPESRERRARSGLPPEPLACVVTRTGNVPSDIPLFSNPEARIVVFGPRGMQVESGGAQLEVAQLDPGELTLTTVLRRLRSEYRIRSLLCEGGPTLFSGMLQEQLVDELFLTLAPKLTGGGMEPTLTSGPELPELALLELVWALERAGSLYLRYRLV